MRLQLTSIALIAVLSACGGGGGGSASSTSSTVTIAGAVIDGYIEGAVVCLDVNGNSACDPTEPKATTDSNGNYSISYTGSTTGLHVLTEVPSTAKDKDDGGLTLAQAGKTAFTLQAPAPATSSTSTHVTPLSTIVSQEMISSGSTNAAAVETQLKTQLGITSNLLNYDFKASTSTANTNAAALAVAITQAISAAQTSLAGSDAFKTALGTTDTATIKAAAAQGAINLVMKNVLPQMIDKDTGGLSSTVSTASAMEAATAVATSNTSKMAVQAKAPKAENGALQAFLDGIVIGGNDSSGDYYNESGVRVNGNWSGYTNALQVEFLKVKADMQTSSEVRKVLVNNKWYTKYDSGGNYFLTSSGWLAEAKDLPGAPIGDCVGGLLTSKGPTQKICMTKYDYSGKKVSSLLKDACKDNSGNSISGCSEDTVFPANTYSYTATISYDEESYKMWVDTTWGGYGSVLNPAQTTLSGFLSNMISTNNTVYIGNSCNVSVKVKSFNSSTMSGEFSFADASNYTCSNVYLNDSKLDYSKHTAAFSLKERAGSKMVVFKVPMIYVKNNPNDSSVWRLFGEYNNGIWAGNYFPTGYSQTFGLDGSMKIGNKNLLNTYLTMVGAPAFPYPQ
jgi:hypothetical protein